MSSLKLLARFSNYSKNIIFSKRCCSNKCVRVRFAPSPTGYLHLGGLRTALYNHLFAKSQNGVSVLRIEDTDQTKKVEGATENLINDLAWCGIKYDEGPYFQSERIELYQKYAKQLLEQGDAYYCFCSGARLLLSRREAVKIGQIPRYDNCCRDLPEAEKNEKLKSGITPCIRFKLLSCTEEVQDLIQGPVVHDVAALEGDPVILKSDGFPTYHFANVIDDHLMNISHVLRGVEWLSSTTKHILLYKALKWDPPLFAHLPLLLNPNGTKLSKRQGDAQIGTLRQNGFLPNAVLNFIVRFGGGFDIKQKERDMKIFTLEELAEKFDLSKIKIASCKTFTDILKDYNQLEIKRLLETEEGANSLVELTRGIVTNRFQNSQNERKLLLERQHILFILNVTKCRINKLEDLVSEDFTFLWIWESNWSPEDEFTINAIENFLIEVAAVEWNTEELKQFLTNFKEAMGVKVREVYKSLRKILTGSEQGVGIFELLEVLGKEQVLFRLTTALKSSALKSRANQK